LKISAPARWRNGARGIALLLNIVAVILVPQIITFIPHTLMP